MLNRLFGHNTHTYIQLFVSCLLLIALPTSKAFMSISILLLVLNILLEADYKSYYANLKNSKIFLLIVALFIWHLISLLWSNNTDYGLHDVKVKLPLLVLPLVFISKPLESKNWRIVLGFFVATIVFTSIYNFLAYHHLIGNYHFDDIRGLSLFSSHVRYSLLVSAAIATALYFIIYKRDKYQLIFVFALGWLLFYSYYSQVISGLITTIGVITVYIIYFLWKINKWVGIASLTTVLIIVLLGANYLFSPVKYNPDDFKNLPKQTINGNAYSHRLAEVCPETNKPINIFINREELKKEWEKVSKLEFEGKTPKGHPMDITLIRYMASLDLTKDSLGFQSLTSEDIDKIEHGCASVYCTGIMARVSSLKYQLGNNKDPNGHSLLQRFEFWRTAIHIAQQNLIFGVGVGDVQDLFDISYENQHSKLSKENRKRSHNMYLTILLSIGLPGLFLFMWLHAEILTSQLQEGYILGASLITIVLLSYLIEDTIETQTGAFFVGIVFAFCASYGNSKLNKA